MIELSNIQEQNDLRDILLKLTSKYKIDYLFLRQNQVVNIERRFEIIILLSNKETRSIGEIDPQITMDLLKYPLFSHITFVSASVKDKLIQGNLFLFSACHPDKKLFKNPSSTFELYPEEFTAQKNATELLSYFQRENFKISEFKEGYEFYLRKGNFSFAAFMMHQVFELRFRCMEILTMGKEKTCHNIRSHQRYLGKSTSLLQIIFSENEDNDERLLSLLNEVYCAVRYEDEYKVEKEDLCALESKMHAFLIVTEELFQESLACFENSYISHQNHFSQPKMQSPEEILAKDLPKHPNKQTILNKIFAISEMKWIH